MRDTEKQIQLLTVLSSLFVVFGIAPYLHFVIDAPTLITVAVVIIGIAEFIGLRLFILPRIFD